MIPVPYQPMLDKSALVDYLRATADWLETYEVDLSKVLIAHWSNIGTTHINFTAQPLEGPYA